MTNEQNKIDEPGIIPNNREKLKADLRRARLRLRQEENKLTSAPSSVFVRGIGWSSGRFLKRVGPLIQPNMPASDFDEHDETLCPFRPDDPRNYEKDDEIDQNNA